MIYKFDKFVNMINEVHYEDMYGKGFKEFYDKYSKLIKNKTINPEEYFVHFSNHRKTDLDKTAFFNPDHRDPVGTYAYPLKYIISHPADVWYGKTAKNLFVLRDNSKRKLVLNDIQSENDIYSFLYDLGYTNEQITKYLKIVKKTYSDRNTGKNKYAKQFLSIIQMDLDKAPTENGWGKPEYATKSGEEQTKILSKKYDAVQDTSTTSTLAIINEREPEQIIFLNRYAYDIEEIFYLHSDNKRSQLLTFTDPSDTIERRLAADVSKLMDDIILGKAERAGLGGWGFYWTKKGRRLEIMWSRPDSYYQGKKFGEKKHKEDKKFDAYELNLCIRSEYGDIEIAFTPDSKYQEILDIIKEDWDKLVKENNKTEWTPETRQSFLKKKEDEKMAAYKAKWEKEKQDEIKDIPNLFKRLENYAKKHNLPFEPYKENYTPDDRNCNLTIYDAYYSLMNLHNNQHGFTNLEELHDFLYTEVKGIKNKRFFGDGEFSKQFKDIIYDVYKNNAEKLFSENNIYVTLREILEQ